MANTLSAISRTRLAWNLSEPQNVGSVSKSVETVIAQTISHGTGPNQATVALTNTFSVTGTSTTQIDLGYYYERSFGYDGLLTFSTLKEAVINVSTGPTGGYLTVGLPTGVTGVRLNVGGQLHVADYLTGYGIGASPAYISLKSNVTGTYSVDVTAIGVGTYANIY